MPEAGWFPDPGGDPSRQRYFDGTSWTEHTAPIGPAPDPAAPTGEPAPPSPAPPSVAPAAKRSSTPIIVGLAVLVVLALVIGGVVLVTRSGSGTTATGGGAGAPATAGWTGFLAHVPDFTTIDRANVQAVDTRTLRTHVGLDAHDLKYSGKTSELARLGVQQIPSFWNDDIEMWRDQAGFLPFEPDRSFEIVAPPEVQIAVLTGTFDPAKVTAALRTGSGVGPDATVETYAGESFLRGPGDELRTNPRTAKSGLDSLGRPLRVLVAADHMIVSLTDAGMRLAIDAWAGRSSAATQPKVAKAAQALDQVGALTLVSSTAGSDDDSRQGSSVPASGAPAAPVIVGVTVRGATAGSYLVAVEASEADAKQAVTNFRTLVEDGSSDSTRRPWDELLAIDQLTAEGTVVVATLTTERPTTLVQALFTRESLVQL